AMLTNLNLTGMGASLLYEVPELLAGGPALVSMPLYHIGGCGWGLAAISSGGCAVIAREVVPQELVRIIPERKVETAFLVPAVLLFITQLPEAQTAEWSSLKNMVYG